MSFAIAMLSMHTSPLDSPGRTKDAGGMNVYIRELARELAQHHVQVDIFTRRTNEQSPTIVQLGPQVRVIHINAGPQAPVHKNDLYQYAPTFARRIDEFRRRESLQYDLIHSHYWLSGIAAMRLACHWRVPHVTMFHTLGRLKQQANPEAEEPQLRLDMEQQLIHKVDRIIAATEDERAQIIRHNGAIADQIEVVPCGVDLNLFVPHEQQHVREQLGLYTPLPILLYAGRLDPFKGPDILLRAAAIMKRPVQIVIAGGNLAGDPDLQNLQRLAAALQIEQRVRFIGSRPRAEMPLIYSAADVTVVPSYHESFGLAAVEALACGTPVVATRAGGLMTVVQDGETGYLVPHDVRSFAERLDTLLADPARRIQMSAAARPSVLRFGWEHVAGQVHDIYYDLIHEERSLIA